MQQQANPNAPFLFLIFIALAAYAIAGSDKKWKAFGIILLSAVFGLAVGAIVGIVMAAGGTLAGLLTNIAGAAASIRQIVDNRRRRKGAL
jgi:hypothetical protein